MFQDALPETCTPGVCIRHWIDMTSRQQSISAEMDDVIHRGKNECTLANHTSCDHTALTELGVVTSQAVTAVHSRCYNALFQNTQNRPAPKPCLRSAWHVRVRVDVIHLCIRKRRVVTHKCYHKTSTWQLTVSSRYESTLHLLSIYSKLFVCREITVLS